MAFSTPEDIAKIFEWSEEENEALDLATIILYRSKEFTAWFLKQENVYASMGHIATDEMRANL